jgi:predicted N-formylglutamate amidohydrolase
MPHVADWPPAVEIVNPAGRSAVVLLCPHASNYIPPEYANLGLPREELERHIAWDIGTAGLVRQLSAMLDAPAFLGTYSRLVIDLNRPPDSPSSIVSRSEYTTIPGNLSLGAEERRCRSQRIFEPYHAAVRAHVAERAAAGRAAIIFPVHSFTPRYLGEARKWHAGVLFQNSKAFARATIERLRGADPALNVAANVPYVVTRDSDFALLVYGDDLGNPAIEVEIRQDLLASAADEAAWAQRLAAALALDVALTVFPKSKL